MHWLERNVTLIHQTSHLVPVINVYAAISNITYVDSNGARIITKIYPKSRKKYVVTVNILTFTVFPTKVRSA